ncbi:MAG: hypothetical protein HYX69_04395 [Planctomycetia bacterium]|nr:hypothetical protein [Planctomycetia bacterium]
MLCASLVAASCSRESGDERATRDQLRVLVSSVADAANKPRDFQALFLPDARPTDEARKQYALRTCTVKAVDLHSDLSATIHVGVESADGATTDVDWTAQRGDSGWKLKTAPLP